MVLVRLSIPPDMKITVGAFSSFSSSKKDVVGRNNQLWCLPAWLWVHGNILGSMALD